MNQVLLYSQPYTDALVYSAKRLKYKQSGILNKVIQTGHKEEVV